MYMYIYIYLKKKGLAEYDVEGTIYMNIYTYIYINICIHI
jgi:hypothetical protein